MQNDRWFKEDPGNKIWWLDNGDEVTGEFIFSFDKKKQFNLFADYPHNLTQEQREIFDKENPYWATYFLGEKQ